MSVCMDFNRFAEKVRVDLQERLAGGHEVYMHETLKNNGVVLKGVCIRDSREMAPIIYLEGYYEGYVKGGMSVDEAEDGIMEDYRRCRGELAMDAEGLWHWESVREKVFLKAINYEKNKGLLANVPCKRYLDLAIVAGCLMWAEAGGRAAMLVEKEHTDMWGISEETLFAAAEANTPKLLPPRIRPLREVLAEMLHIRPKEEGQWEGEDSVFCLSNDICLEGAYYMAHPGILRDFADEMGSDVYILPSSIHEVLLIPDIGAWEPHLFRSMVKEVNEEAVSAEDFLSGSVYKYVRETGEAVIYDAG